MTREEAIELIRKNGFHAFERDWSLGASIGLAWGPQNHAAIRSWTNMLYIYGSDATWRVFDCSRHLEASFETLLEAVGGALAHAQDSGASSSPFKPTLPSLRDWPTA